MAISALSSDQKRQALSIFKDVEFHRLTAYTEDNFPPPATSEQKCSPDHKVQRPVVTSTYLADGARVWAPGRLSEEHTRPSFAGIPDIPHQLVKNILFSRLLLMESVQCFGCCSIC
ncbi:Hypothetical predicted protein [Pelobates cultripes]|uniref:Uncharacterized protein n=1 Tax=Pelobates cultripes TaxID=61616 RepID=A0AAD1WL02_PELCU|nr:Hypothetical predicted protein [Pelobates cultripes]